MDNIWEVVAGDSYDPGNPSNGAQEQVILRGNEEEARRVYADSISEAAERGHAYVKLRCGGGDVETWPPPTGWTV
ncbi:hypothetical protein [Mycolicibacterium sp. P1-5]|uniref:hypothetical protein n=1 Tax=Mycolicibacterium sp. P1-5 TaxID=2024617 RepID=UPI0011ECDA5D|nr:hypothetical protein [Mycolicibacterium sp. P1-5]KAA0109765.1 hypothetical protein CIW47_09190 [Mycolicibacterium sp. P1-5]